MWINLDKDVIEAWAKIAEEHGDKDVADDLRQKITDAFHPDNKKWVEAAKSIHQDEGTVEVDEQSDDSAMISISEDGGAYVLSWVWVYNEDAGFPAKEDDDETWSGSPDPADPDNFWIDDKTGERVPAPDGKAIKEQNPDV